MRSCRPAAHNLESGVGWGQVSPLSGSRGVCLSRISPDEKPLGRVLLPKKSSAGIRVGCLVSEGNEESDERYRKDSEHVVVEIGRVTFAGAVSLGIVGRLHRIGQTALVNRGEQANQAPDACALTETSSRAVRDVRRAGRLARRAGALLLT